MFRFLQFALALAILADCAQVSRCQSATQASTTEADESQISGLTVAERMITAVGGKSALEQVQGWNVTVSATSGSSQSAASGTQSWINSRASTTQSPAVSNEHNAYTWLSTDKQALTAPKTPFLLDLGIYSLLSPVPPTEQLLGTSTVDGHNVFVLQVIVRTPVWPHQPFVRTWYVDQSTNLPVMVTYPSVPLTNDKVVSISYSDFAVQQGITLPTTITVSHPMGPPTIYKVASLVISNAASQARNN